jgi:DHA1 family multidrug resistance protein-like MFS transporter
MVTTRGVDGAWPRIEFALVSSVFLYFAGTSFVLPFLPLYVQQLAYTDVVSTAIWAGLILGTAPLVSGIVAPIWGRLSDRIGQKLLLQRSLLGFTICLGLMGLAQSPLQLLLIRAAMGLVGGFSVTTQALVSVQAPRELITRAIGRTNAARVLGMAIGPLPGGLLADAIGIRWACLATVVGGIGAIVIISLLVPRAPKTVNRIETTHPASRFLTLNFVTLITVITTIRFVEKSFDPVLPLIVQRLADRPFGTATATAIVVSAGLVAAAIGSMAVSGIAGERPTTRRSLLVSLMLVSAVFSAAIYITDTWLAVLALRIAAGGSLGVAASLAISQVALTAPQHRRGSALGVVGSGTAAGSAAGLLGAGALTVVALPAVFLLDGGLLALAGLVHWLWGRPDSVETTPSAVSS